jgi:hypothetical protein
MVCVKRRKRILLDFQENNVERNLFMLFVGTKGLFFQMKARGIIHKNLKSRRGIAYSQNGAEGKFLL